MNPIHQKLRIVCVLALTGVWAQAQSSGPDEHGTTSAAVSTKEDNVVMLSPFIVDSSADKGYRATNSISGSRLNTAIKDLPMSLEVITSDFIKDIGATDLRQALTYSAGIVTESQADFAPDINSVSDDPQGITGSKEQTGVKIRGFMTTETLRNGFRRASASDAINIDRVEVVRGPSALLYGVGNVGGIVNYLTKRPETKPSYSLTATTGSWDFFRSSVDFTGPLGDKLGAAYRLTGAYETSKDWTEFKGYTRKFISPVVQFRPFENTSILLDFEAGQTHYDGIAFQSIRATVKGLSSPAARRLSGFLPTPGKDHKTFRWGGPDAFRDEHNRNFAGEITQKIGDDLTLLLGGQVTKTDFFTRNVRAQINVYGSTVPAYVDPSLVRVISFYPVGLNPRLNRNSVLAYSWSTEDDEIETRQARAELNYHFKLGSTDHNLLLGRTEQSRTSDTLVMGLPYNRLDLFSYKAPDDLTYFRYDPATQSPLQRTDDNTVDSWDSGSYLVWQGKFFSNKLQTVAGVRYDRSDARTTLRDLTTGAVSSVVGSTTGKAITKTSPQFGLNYSITNALSVYGLYSTGLIPNYDRTDGNGAPFKPANATSREVGVKIDLLNGKISGTIAAYRIERKDTPYYVWWAPNNTRHVYDPTKPVSYEINGTVYYENNPADLAVIQAASAAQYNPDGTGPSYDVSYGYGAGNNPSLDQGAYCPVDDDSKGMDAQLILSPTNNWQVVLTYAHVTRKITQGPAFVKYLHNDPYALWMLQQESLVDIYGGGPATNYSDPTDTSTYNRSFAKGLAADDTPTDTVSVWSHYSFHDSNFGLPFLKGLSVGAGAKYEAARNYLGSALTSDGAILKPTSGNVDRFDESDAKLIVDGLVSYQTKLGKSDWTFSLNVFNLLDNQKRYGDIYQAPRSMRFTAGVKF